MNETGITVPLEYKNDKSVSHSVMNAKTRQASRPIQAKETRYEKRRGKDIRSRTRFDERANRKLVKHKRAFQQFRRFQSLVRA